MEYKLAVINAGGYVPEDDLTVTQFAALLDRLEAKCTDSREMLSDMTVKAHELLQEGGVQWSLLEVMKGINELVVYVTAEESCAEPIAFFVTLALDTYGR